MWPPKVWWRWKIVLFLAPIWNAEIYTCIFKKIEWFWWSIVIGNVHALFICVWNTALCMENAIEVCCFDSFCMRWTEMDADVSSLPWRWRCLVRICGHLEGISVTIVYCKVFPVVLVIDKCVACKENEIIWARKGENIEVLYGGFGGKWRRYLHISGFKEIFRRVQACF